jgi:hypothetical protein
MKREFNDFFIDPDKIIDPNFTIVNISNIKSMYVKNAWYPFEDFCLTQESADKIIQLDHDHGNVSFIAQFD